MVKEGEMAILSVADHREIAKDMPRSLFGLRVRLYRVRFSSLASRGRGVLTRPLDLPNHRVNPDCHYAGLCGQPVCGKRDAQRARGACPETRLSV